MREGDRVCVCRPGKRCLEGKYVEEVYGGNNVRVDVDGDINPYPIEWVKPREDGCGDDD